MPQQATEQKFVLTRVATGDYLLPSNDAQTIWRIHRYVEGPSTGLDWPRDRQVWGIWKWREVGTHIDPDDWDAWEFWDGLFDKRSQAVDVALRGGR